MTDAFLEDSRRKQHAALINVLVKCALTAAKFVAAGLSGSLALASEAGNNLADIAAGGLTFYSIRAAMRPADEEHQFGHGKVEAVAALAQTGFLFALALFVLIEAAKRLINGHVDVEPGVFAFAVLIVSILVDTVRWRSVKRLAHATKSAALAADALNFATDIVASALALAGLLAASLGFAYGDALAALAVALFVGIAGWSLGRATVATLIDEAPKGLNDPIRAAIASVAGVISVETLRLRPIGPSIHGDAVVTVPRTLSIEKVTGIKHAIQEVLRQQFPEASLLVTTEPVALDDETVIERVQMVANRRRVPIHHLTIQTLPTGKSVSFDAELDGAQSLASAHETITSLEAAIADELGAEFEIESHIEPMTLAELDGRECADRVAGAISESLHRRAPETGPLTEIHDIRVRETAAGLVVNYHCLAEPSLSVEAVHAHVDALDRRVREDCENIARIVGHAEPRTGGGIP